MAEGEITLPVYDYQQLSPGLNFFGPALIVSEDTTIFIDANDKIDVDMYQNLLIDVYLGNI